jgi:hypothetical protein
VDWDYDRIFNDAQKLWTSNRLDIKEPPCKMCEHWKPRFVTNGIGEFDGVRMCESKDMFPDFSCYVKRKGALEK